MFSDNQKLVHKADKAGAQWRKGHNNVGGSCSDPILSSAFVASNVYLGD